MIGRVAVGGWQYQSAVGMQQHYAQVALYLVNLTAERFGLPTATADCNCYSSPDSSQIFDFLTVTC